MKRQIAFLKTQTLFARKFKLSRRVLVEQFPFAIWSKIEGDAVVIACLHIKRNPAARERAVCSVTVRPKPRCQKEHPGHRLRSEPMVVFSRAENYMSHASGIISVNLRVALRGRASSSNGFTFSFRGIWLAIPLKMQVPVGKVGMDSSVTRSM